MTTKIDYTEVKGHRVVYIHHDGDITYDSLEGINKLLEQVLEEEFSALVFNMENIEFLDSSGAGVLTRVQKDVRRKNAIFILEKIRPRPRRVLEFLKIHREFIFSPGDDQTSLLLERNFK